MVRKAKTQADETPEVNNSIEINVGLILKEARVSQKLSLEDVSKTLCITKSFLMRLEDHSEALPVDVYTLGFLRSYAKFLGLNSDELSEQFKSSNITIEKVEELTFPKPLPRRGIPHVRVVSISLAFAFLLVVGWETITKMSPTHPATLDVEKVSLENAHIASAHAMVDAPEGSEGRVIKVAAVEMPAQPAKVFTGEIQPKVGTQPQMLEVSKIEASPLLEKNAEPSQIQSGTFEAVQSVQLENTQAVVISFSEESWVQVKDSHGQVVVNRTFKPGEQYELKSPQGCILKVGNAGGINLIVAGKDMGKLGTTGQVMGNISLDPEKLLAQQVKTH